MAHGTPTDLLLDNLAAHKPDMNAGGQAMDNTAEQVITISSRAPAKSIPAARRPWTLMKSGIALLALLMWASEVYFGIFTEEVTEGELHTGMREHPGYIGGRAMFWASVFMAASDASMCSFAASNVDATVANAATIKTEFSKVEHLQLPLAIMKGLVYTSWGIGTLSVYLGMRPTNPGEWIAATILALGQLGGYKASSEQNMAIALSLIDEFIKSRKVKKGEHAPLIEAEEGQSTPTSRWDAIQIIVNGTGITIPALPGANNFHMRTEIIKLTTGLAARMASFGFLLAKMIKFAGLDQQIAEIAFGIFGAIFGGGLQLFTTAPMASQAALRKSRLNLMSVADLQALKDSTEQALNEGGSLKTLEKLQSTIQDLSLSKQTTTSDKPATLEESTTIHAEALQMLQSYNLLPNNGITSLSDLSITQCNEILHTIADRMLLLKEVAALKGPLCDAVIRDKTACIPGWATLRNQLPVAILPGKDPITEAVILFLAIGGLGNRALDNAAYVRYFAGSSPLASAGGYIIGISAAAQWFQTTFSLANAGAVSMKAEGASLGRKAYSCAFRPLLEDKPAAAAPGVGTTATPIPGN